MNPKVQKVKRPTVRETRIRDLSTDLVGFVWNLVAKLAKSGHSTDGERPQNSEFEKNGVE